MTARPAPPTAAVAAATPAAERAAPAKHPRNLPNNRDLVSGLERGLAVIAAFDHGRPRLSISEVAELCAVSRAAARRYLITLEHLGYVQCERRLYMLTPKVLRLAQSYMHSSLLPSIVEPALHRLANGLHEASSAGVLNGDDVLCIAATTAGRVVSMTLQPGLRTLTVQLAGRQGQVRAAINVSVHAARFSMAQLVATCLPPLRQAQADLRPLL